MCELDPPEPNKVDDNRSIHRSSSGTHSQEQGSQGIHSSQGSSSPGSYPACDNFVIQSKYLKGQLDPPVSNGHVFWTKGGQLDRGVSDVTFFGPKDVSFLVGFHGFSR